MIRLLGIVILLGAIYVAFAAVKWLKVRRTDAEQITLAITLAGTLLGVLLALWTGDMYQYVRERQRLLNLYDAAELEFQAHIGHIGSAIQLASALDATQVGSTVVPRILDNIIQDVSLHQYFSPTMRAKMYSGLGSSPSAPLLQAMEIAKDNKDSSYYREVLIILYCQLEFQRRFINVEQQYLSWRMSSSRVQELWEQFTREEDQQREEMKRREWKALDMKGQLLYKEKDRAPK